MPFEGYMLGALSAEHIAREACRQGRSLVWGARLKQVRSLVWGSPRRGPPQTTERGATCI